MTGVQTCALPIFIGVGVKSSTSDLLIANCDEFIFYDDLVRDSEKPARRKRRSGKKTASKKKSAKTETAESKAESTSAASTESATNGADTADDSGADDRLQEALDLVMATVEDLFRERGEEDKVWGSMVKRRSNAASPVSTRVTMVIAASGNCSRMRVTAAC